MEAAYRPIDEYRARLLADLERRRRLDDLGALVRAHVVPLVQDVSSRHPSYWARFNEAHLRTSRSSSCRRKIPGPGSSRSNDPLPATRSARCSGTSARSWRVVPNRMRRVVSRSARLVISTVAAWERDQEAKRDSPSSEDFADELSDLVVAVLARPLVSATVVPARA